MAQAASRREVYLGLVHILRVGAEHASNEEKVLISTKVNLAQMLAFIRQFLQKTDGGSRLVAVWGAFEALLSENGKIKVYSPNVSDFFAKTAGDVEVYYNGLLVSASECKQRPLTLDDVTHGIKKGRDKGVPQYMFVISAGMASGQQRAIRQALRAHAKELDLALVDIGKDARILAALLNPLRRAQFGQWVTKLLRRMRKSEAANAGANLWNMIIN